MNTGVLAGCMAVEAELTEALTLEHKKLQGEPASIEFVIFCLTLRNELLVKHGVLLVDWIAFNQGHSFQEKAAA